MCQLVYYMERDLEDKKYKPISQLSNNIDEYILGELFLVSNSEDLPKKVKVKTICGERIVYDELIHVSDKNLYSEFKLEFSESGLAVKDEVIIRAYKLNHGESDFPHAWILFEVINTVKILDTLEDNNNYNLLGESEIVA
ncbi:hypothetical protein INR79_09080 [Vibrio sp. SCSIO 43132]|uniref:hypothetical protein n=1 Tax=Vibrio sp. SCSIO 43132 TaxID=2779363 RepID=UPI001CA85E15|nr:hypothetical protein [Vibrio sp. SCSIO 43132]UAB68705.1 hypothetical protein INR79_09080 [Vibrio sp. SCSIO 43132]